MPNGRRKSGRTRAANHRRNQERDAAAPPDPPLFVRIILEEMATHGEDGRAAFMAAMQRCLCLGMFDDIEEVRAWVGAVTDMFSYADLSFEDVAQGFEAVTEWQCADEQAMRALASMRLADAPEPIIEAFHKSACVETTVADSAVQEDLGSAHHAQSSPTRSPRRWTARLAATQRRRKCLSHATPTLPVNTPSASTAF